MGLAAAKKRTKLANDPNNTRWARNTESVGQKILRSQGWEPGQYLGVKDAPHAALHTAANASHIRAVLREDNLGLGAQRNRGDECTGLDAFQDLLGRLNGKTQNVLESERKAREDVKISLYVQRKLGTMNFVAGGLLVGDKIKASLNGDDWDSSEDKDGEAVPTQGLTANDEAKLGEGKKTKRRKVESSEVSGLENSDSPRPEEKRRKKRQTHEDDAGTEPKEHRSREKRSKKLKKPRSGGHNDGDDPEATTTSQSVDDIVVSEDKSLENTEGDMCDGSRCSKRSRKEKRCADRGDVPSESDTGRPKKAKRRKDRESSGDTSVAATPTNTPQTGTSTPAASGTTTPSQIPLRHLSRQRFIAQKRLSVLDQQALNQIFMVKPEVPS